MGQYGGTSWKKGGAKLDSPMNAKDKGVPKGGSYPGKQSWSKKGGIDTPMTQGNKGVVIDKSKPKGPPIAD